MHLLAYNLIRLLMAQAASNAGLVPREISFKHTVQLWTQWQCKCFGHRKVDVSILFTLIAQRTVGNRPGRREPRACKLTWSPAEAQTIIEFLDHLRDQLWESHGEEVTRFLRETQIGPGVDELQKKLELNDD